VYESDFRRTYRRFVIPRATSDEHYAYLLEKASGGTLKPYSHEFVNLPQESYFINDFANSIRRVYIGQEHKNLYGTRTDEATVTRWKDWLGKGFKTNKGSRRRLMESAAAG
jgi:hypothetical protein